ncbi:MAG: cytochrome c [Polyangiaceae bacterium]
MRRLACTLAIALLACRGRDDRSRDDGASAPSAASSSMVPQPPSAVLTSAPSPPSDALAGQNLIVRFECARCHDGAQREPVAENKHCFHCHQQITDGTFKAPAPLLAAWRPRARPLRFTPSLAGVGRLLRPDWVERFLLEPFDVRPACVPEMPRLALDASQAHAIVQALVLAASQTALPALAPGGEGALENGARLFKEKGCIACHSFSGSGLSPPAAAPEPLPRERVLAPDLRFARDRLVRDSVAPYILDPESIKPGAAMPKPSVTEDEARALAAYILDSPLAPVPPPEPPPRLPLLDRPVTYNEVAERVLHKVCWHCHSQPDFARGDGGPGNTGGFGFAPRRADLSAFENLAAGYLDDQGQRVSLFDEPRGVPLLLEALLARQAEARGDRAAIRGMPLGLPPLSPVDIQLVETWIAQGHLR